MPPRLQPAAFNAFLGDNIGQDFQWRRASICPCTNPLSGAATPQCPKCAGKGRLWAAPVDAKAGMTQQRINKVFAQMGLYEAGDATLTIHESSAMYDAGHFDRITMLNSTDRFDLVLTRGDPTERLFFKVQSLERVFWYTGKNGEGEVREGALPTVADDGTLEFGAGGPPAGKQYSISGTRYAEYYVWDGMPSDRNEHFGARLPKRVIARRFDLFGR